MSKGPPKYTDELAEYICEQLAVPRSLRSICCDDFPGMVGKSTVMDWLRDARHVRFKAMYREARVDQTEAWADEIIDLADDGSNDYMEALDAKGQPTGKYVLNKDNIRRSRLRVQVRSHMMSVTQPRKYGTRHMVEGDPENPLRMLLDAVQGKVLKSATQKTIEQDLHVDSAIDQNR
jgi:hypothetical protein